eukprot:11570315-Alexandrium_andersonii.AAC.1
MRLRNSSHTLLQHPEKTLTLIKFEVYAEHPCSIQSPHVNTHRAPQGDCVPPCRPLCGCARKSGADESDDRTLLAIRS